MALSAERDGRNEDQLHTAKSLVVKVILQGCQIRYGALNDRREAQDRPFRAHFLSNYSLTAPQDQRSILPVKAIQPMRGEIPYGTTTSFACGLPGLSSYTKHHSSRRARSC